MIKKHATVNLETDARTEAEQPVSQIMHWWFLADMVLVSIAGFQLFVLGEQTNRFFAWTIQSALTAAFLGASYWGTVPMLYQSFRARKWVNARIAIPGVWLFTVLTSIATFQHWDRFHANSPILTARLAFWVWLVIYIIVPIGVVIAWNEQRRVPGREPEREAPLPLWFRLLLGGQALLILLLGAELYLFPNATLPFWVWTLTPLTSAAVGAWLVGIGVTLAWAIWENDWQRLHGMMQTYALLGILQLISVARYAEEMNWSNPTAWLYVVFLASILIMGGLGTYLVGRRPSA